MSEDEQAGALDDTSPEPGWREALDELERSLRSASRAIGLLRHSLEEDGPAPRPALAAVQDTEPSSPPQESAEPAQDSAGRSSFERLWDRIEHERMEKQAKSSPNSASARRGLELLPQQYLMTVEDRESKVDLVPLHRALLSLEGMEEVSLVSFANGVPVISLRVEGELDLERLGQAVSTAMDRECETIPQDNGRLFLRLKSRQHPGG